MANRLTPFGLVLKWLIIPIAVGAIGYYLVGPRVESNVSPELIDKVKSASGIEVAEAKEVKPDTAERTYKEPEVDVTVTALNKREDKPKRRRRKRTTTPKPSVTAPVAPEPAVAPPPPTVDGGDGTGGD